MIANFLRSLRESQFTQFVNMLKSAYITFDVSIEDESDDTNYCIECFQRADGEWSPSKYRNVIVGANKFVFSGEGELIEVIEVYVPEDEDGDVLNEPRETE